MESQVRCAIGIAFINSISRLSVPFPSPIFGFLWLAAGEEGAFCGGLSGGG